MATWFDQIIALLEQKGVSPDVVKSVAQVYLKQREATKKDGQEAFAEWVRRPGPTNIKSTFLAGYRAKNL